MLEVFIDFWYALLVVYFCRSVVLLALTIPSLPPYVKSNRHVGGLADGGGNPGRDLVGGGGAVYARDVYGTAHTYGLCNPHGQPGRDSGCHCRHCQWPHLPRILAGTVYTWEKWVLLLCLCL